MKLYVDIETIPGETMPELSEIKAPANYKDPEKILAYQKENQLEAYKKQALNSMEGRILCVGYCIDTGKPGVLKVNVLSGDEKELITEFERIVKTAFNEPYVFVGWNILSFDIPWLWRKAIQYNLVTLKGMIPKSNPRMVVDLMKLWAADFKDYVKMSGCAKFLNIAHSPTSGSDVYDMWRSGDVEAIKRHCREDVATLMEIDGRIT
uniref:Putative DNA polymerase n=1 Tax=viral metagenome TaxID=1070528 RepID=A0A6H1Z6U2_9ZZZZ